MSWRPPAVMVTFTLIGPIVGSMLFLPFTPASDWIMVMAFGFAMGVVPAMIAGAVLGFWTESKELRLGESFARSGALGAASGLIAATFIGSVVLLITTNDLRDVYARMVLLCVLAVPGSIAGAICALLLTLAARWCLPGRAS